MSGYLEAGLSVDAFVSGGGKVIGHVEQQLAKRLSSPHDQVSFTWYAQVAGEFRWRGWTPETPLPAGTKHVWCRAIAIGPVQRGSGVDTTR
jgi:hypothetical protein